MRINEQDHILKLENVIIFIDTFIGIDGWGVDCTVKVHCSVDIINETKS